MSSPSCLARDHETFYMPYFLLALALLGISVAFYDAYAIYNDQPLWCPPLLMGAMKWRAAHMHTFSNCPSDILVLCTTFACLAWRHCSHSIHLKEHFVWLHFFMPL
jgi:hypothetical protein